MGNNSVDRKDLNNEIKGYQDTSGAKYGTYQNYLAGQVDKSAPMADDERNQIWSGYTGASQNGALDPTVAANMRNLYGQALNSTGAGGSGGGSGIGGGSGSLNGLGNPYAESRGIFSELGKSGGDFASYGGYQNFANNGGMNNQARQDYRSRATSGVPALYGQLQNQLSRTANIQGLSGAGMGSAMARLGHQSAQDEGDALLNAETSLADQVRQGKLAGLGGMTGIEGQVAQNRLAAANQLFGVDRATQADKQAAAAAGAASSNAAMARQLQAIGMGLSAEQYLGSTGQQGQLAGLGGLAGLYGGAGNGQLNTFLSMYGTSLGNQDQGQSSLYGNRTQLATAPQGQSWYDKALGAAPGILNSFGGGGGGGYETGSGYGDYSGGAYGPYDTESGYKDTYGTPDYMLNQYGSEEAW